MSFCLSGAQLGITFAALLTGFIAEPVFAAVLEPGLAAVGVSDGARSWISLTLAFVVSTFALMVLGELAPKNLAIAIPDRVARFLAGSTLLFMRVGGPVIRLFDGAANRLLKVVGVTPIQEAHGAVSVEDLARIIDSSGAAGQLSPQEAGLLGRALDFGALTAADVMVPRPRVTTLDEDARGEQLRRLLRTTGHSRVPLTRGAAETVVGVVSIKDLLDLPVDGRDTAVLQELARPVLRVPENAPLAEVVGQLRGARTQFAVVVDEFGSDVGILTLEDVVEELVGEIRDEYDRGSNDENTPPAAGLAPQVVPGSLHPHEFARRTGLRLPDGRHDTLAGFILNRLGRLAEVGDEVTAQADVDRPDDSDLPARASVVLRVESLTGRAVGNVRVTATGRDLAS